MDGVVIRLLGRESMVSVDDMARYANTSSFTTRAMSLTIH
jgi:hypothetical protein